MSALDKLAAHTVGVSFSDTSNKDYNKLQSYVNATSYSMTQELHRCPRRFQLIKARALRGESGQNNVDFAYGHAVGAGIQSWLMSGHNMEAALFNAFLAWRIPFDAEIPKKHKTIWDTWIAVKSYAAFHEEHLDEWAVWILPNGKPAIELSIEIDCENGYKHYMHIDVILQHRVTGQLAIQENKTHGFKDVEPAIYANSAQALSYGIAIDMLADDTSYEVFYVCYSAPERKWDILPFTKTTFMKAEWINDIRLDHAAISAYRQLNFFPKRGENCYAFMRRCEFFGSCNITANAQEFKILGPEEQAERVDYSFKISDVIRKQQERNG